MYLMQCTEEQMGVLQKMLDGYLKNSGLEGLQDAVAIYNLLVSANKLQETNMPQGYQPQLPQLSSQLSTVASEQAQSQNISVAQQKE